MQLITFNILDLESSFSVLRYIFQKFLWRSYIKVIGSTSDEQKTFYLVDCLSDFWTVCFANGCRNRGLFHLWSQHFICWLRLISRRHWQFWMRSCACATYELVVMWYCTFWLHCNIALYSQLFDYSDHFIVTIIMGLQWYSNNCLFWTSCFADMRSSNTSMPPLVSCLL